MRKTAYYIIATILFFSNCKQNNNAKNNTKSNTEMIKANKILSYTNTVSETLEIYTNAAADAIEENVETNEKFTKNEPVIGVFSTDMDFLESSKAVADIAFAAPTPELKEDVAFFRDSIALYKKLFDNFKENNANLKLYITAKDYKDDKYLKGKDILQKQFEIYPQIVRLNSAINNKIDEVAAKAEAISINDSPIKNSILACKGDLKKMKNLVDFMASKQIKFSEEDVLEVDKMYSAFTSSIEQNKVANKQEVEKQNKTVLYNMFYDRLITESAAIKSIIRNVKSAKSLSENDITLLDASYTNAVTLYNAWIQ